MSEKKRPGVIASIAEVITGADKPVTVDEIVEELVKRFPDRAKKSMKSTVKVQIGGKRPTRLEKSRKITLIIKENTEGIKTFTLKK